MAGKQWRLEIKRTGRQNLYKLLIPKDWIYIDHRLDDYKLLPSVFRVLSHLARRSETKDGKYFIIKDPEREFEHCGLSRNTLKSALEYLLDKEFYLEYSYRKNPMCHLYLCDLFEEEARMNEDEEAKTNRESRQLRRLAIAVAHS